MSRADQTEAIESIIRSWAHRVKTSKSQDVANRFFDNLNGFLFAIKITHGDKYASELHDKFNALIQ